MTQNIKEEIPYRPLGLVVSMIKNLGLEVTHCHDDLVFVEHNAFLIQMGDRGEDVFVWFNVECDQGKVGEIFAGLEEQAASLNLILGSKGAYELVANETDETIQIEFLPQ